MHPISRHALDNTDGVGCNARCLVAELEQRGEAVQRGGVFEEDVREEDRLRARAPRAADERAAGEREERGGDEVEAFAVDGLDDVLAELDGDTSVIGNRRSTNAVHTRLYRRAAVMVQVWRRTAGERRAWVLVAVVMGVMGVMEEEGAQYSKVQ